MVFKVTSDPQIDSQSDNLHSSILYPRTSPSPSGTVSSPSDATMSHIASNMRTLAMTLEKHYSSKTDKKNKFKSLDSYTMQMILNASATTNDFSASDPASSLVEILKGQLRLMFKYL